MNNKLILGTVQFGLRYGINNSQDKPGNSEVFSILDLAKLNNIHFLDTASAYGNAIEIIAQYHKTTQNQFKVISKFTYDSEVYLEDYLQSMIDSLNIQYLEAILLHKFDDLINHPNMLEQLQVCKEKKILKYIGISVYTNQQLSSCIDNSFIDIIQVPFNLLDNYNKRGSLLQRAKQKNKIVHTRSVFLQGLLYMSKNIPLKLLPLQKYLFQIQEIASRNNYTISELALNYALTQPFIDNVLIGVDNASQLQENIISAQKGINSNIIEQINSIDVIETELLNPINWN